MKSTFDNPVIPGFHPDPSVCRVGDDFYLATSSFAYFPGVPVYHSRDLAHWNQIGHALTRPAQLALEGATPSGGIFAPTLRHHAGLFYMITTNVSHKGGNFVVTTADPAGEWSDPVWIGGKNIDPDLFWDDDGTVYYTGSAPFPTKAYGIYQCRLNLTTGRFMSEYRLIWKGTGGRYPEGPHVYKIGDWYYLLVAEGGTESNHTETIARSRKPDGPFESCPHNPLLRHRDRTKEVIQCTGHGDLVEDQRGQWWMVFLGTRMPAGPFHHLGRETFLAPAKWDADGWPHIGENGGVTLKMEADLPASVVLPEIGTRDDFDGLKLAPCWNYLRNPQTQNYSLTTRPGWLTLKCSPVTMTELASPSLVCRRQQHFDCTARTRLDFDPIQEGEEAGLVVFMDHEHHYEIMVRGSSGHMTVFVRKQVGDLVAVVAEHATEGMPVILEIRADMLRYEFVWGTDDAKMTVLAEGRTRYLSTEVAGGYTGVFFGLYATSSGKHSENEAHFDWFDYAIQSPTMTVSSTS